jgi:putative endonuclease
MHFVYILNSISSPTKFYVGYTLDIQSRVGVHNAGGSVHTKDHRPWKLHWYGVFDDKLTALAFEKYLKSHSGRAFATKHFSKKMAQEN